MGGPVVHLAEVGAERIPLDQVAGVHDHDLARVHPAQRINDRGGPRDPAGVGGVGDVIPARGPTVHIGGGHNDQPGGVGALAKQAEQQRQEHRTKVGGGAAGG